MSGLWIELPPTKQDVYHYSPERSIYSRCRAGDLGSTNFPITPGEAYIIVVTSDSLWTPNHYLTAAAPPEVSGTWGWPPLKLGKGTAANTVILTFEDKAGAVTGYNVYEGNLGAMYSHGGAPGNVCNVATTVTTWGRRTPAAGIGTAGSRYYLVTAFSATMEGPSGYSSAGVEIPPAMNSCPP
jgi:hypothetical protein